MADPRLLPALSLAALLYAAPVLAPSLWDASPFSISAYADDDDDDDDDDGDDDDDDDRPTRSRDDDDDDDRSAARPRVSRPAPPAPPLPQRADDELVVLGLDDDDLEALIAAGYRVLREGESEGLVLFGVPAGMTVTAALADVATRLPDALAAPNDYYRNQAGPACAEGICDSWEQVGFTPVPWMCPFTPLIGVIDTGINLEHEMLKDAAITVEPIGPAVELPAGVKHGTAVAAMLVGDRAGRVPGMLPEARLHVADPFTGGERGDERADAYGLYLAITRLREAGVEIINLSLAGPDNPVLARAVADAHAADIPLVAAMGNAGPRAEPAYPAAYDTVVAVTAVDPGHAVYRRAGQGPHVDFAAPGVGIATAASISGVRPQTGTSFAAPFVTVALLKARARQPGADLPTVVSGLAAGSVDLGEPGHDPVFGHGLVQIAPIC